MEMEACFSVSKSSKTLSIFKKRTKTYFVTTDAYHWLPKAHIFHLAEKQRNRYEKTEKKSLQKLIENFFDKKCLLTKKHCRHHRKIYKGFTYSVSSHE